jgi:hypothetical protein
MEYFRWARDMVRYLGAAIREHLADIWKSLTGEDVLPHARERGSVGPFFRRQAKREADFAKPGMPNVTENPTVNEATGATAKPNMGSIFAPDTPPGTNPFAIWARRAGNMILKQWREALPRAGEIVEKVPESPVISGHQRMIEREVSYMVRFSEEPWRQALRAREETELVDFEHQVVTRYQLFRAQGMDVDAAKAKAYSEVPPDCQALLMQRDVRRPIEKWSTGVLKTTLPDDVEGPYVARLTNEEGKAVVDLHPQITNWGRHIRASLGSFDRSRVYGTMKEGITADPPVQYDPLTSSTFQRELYSTRLENTARYLQELKDGGVLFEKNDKAGAIAAHDMLQRTPVVRPSRVIRPVRGGKRGNIGPVTLVRGFGGADYWARSRVEAQFLEQNLNPAQSGGTLSKMVRVANAFARNPNLMYNPLPHVTKNMAMKYVLQRVGNLTFQKLAAEYASDATRRAITDQVLPMPTTGTRIPQLRALEAGSYGQRVAAKWGKWLSVNHFSPRFIFAKADPAMRHALLWSYVRKGLTPQEAANHVWVDLIRYDENSGALNFWKSIPFNFFAPWRLGTYVSLFKALRSHPIRALLFIGALEYMREIIYRKLGWWTHLPIDYLEAPLVEAIQDPKTIPGILGTTALFGPGGAQAALVIDDLVKALHGEPGLEARAINMFWGLSQLYNIPQQFAQYLRDHDPKHLGLIISSAAFGTHEALRYQPRRFASFIPESWPGMEKSAQVKEAEALQAKIQQKLQKARTTYEAHHGVSAALSYGTEEGQMEALRRAAGERPGARYGPTTRRRPQGALGTTGRRPPGALSR